MLTISPCLIGLTNYLRRVLAIGAFPDNAAEFWERLKDPSLSDDFLKNVSFSVCGLGSSAYTFFNQAAKNLDRRFEELGATRLCPPAYADERPTEKYMAAFDP